MQQTDTWVLRLRIEGRSEELFYDQTVIRIGREQSCPLCFSDVIKLSRIHAEIFSRGGTWYIRDLASTNGTWLQDVPLVKYQEYPLTPGDIIDLAHTVRIIFVEGRIPLPPVPVPPAKKRFCRYCGSPATGKFCLCCGNVIDNTPEANAYPTPSSAMPAPSMPAPSMPAPSMPAPSMPAPSMCAPPHACTQLGKERPSFQNPFSFCGNLRQPKSS